MTQDELANWLTAQQAAELTGYSTSHIRRLRGMGKIFAIQKGHDWLYSRADVLNLPPRGKAGRKRKPKPE